MSSEEHGKWGEPPKPFDVIAQQVSFLFQEAQDHRGRAYHTVTESCRVLMLFGVGGLATLGGALQAIDSQHTWLLIAPATLFLLTASLAYWAGYHSLGRYHDTARTTVAKRHSEFLEWSLNIAGALSVGGTMENAIDRFGSCPDMPTLDDKYLNEAQCLRDQARNFGAITVVLTIILVSWLLLEGGAASPPPR